LRSEISQAKSFSLRIKSLHQVLLLDTVCKLLPSFHPTRSSLRDLSQSWDAAPDYCHYTKLEARMEAFYIVQEFLRMADEKENNNTTTTTAGDFDRITTDNTTSIFK
jgi:hypothetical protein